VAEEDAAQKAERIRQATAALMDMPDIAQVTLVPEEDAMRLLEPWIKDESLLKTLPLPTLIDVHVAPDKNLESAVLSERLKTLDADIEVDGPGEWFASLMRGINGLAFFAWGMIALTLAVLVLAIALVCRVVLALQHETIDLLHILGARDQDISRQFQNQILRLSALPAILGAVLAGLSAVGAIFLFHKMWDGLFIATSAWSGPFASLLVVPFGAVLIASFAARFFIFRFLRSKA
jgi:cell division transport system permease protein